MPDFGKLNSLPIFQNSAAAWLIAGAVLLGVLAVLLVLRAAIRRYHKKLQATPRTEILEIPVEVLSRTTLLFFIVISSSIGLRTLTLGPASLGVMNSAIMIALFWQAGVWSAAAGSAGLERKRRHSMEVDRAAAGSLGIIGFILNVVIWALVALLTLDNLGINITALVAGLGIGGIAVALALQNVLGDLFASLSIALDRPFVIGDFLSIDDFLGSVEYIGIKTTRLRSLSGEQIIMSNGDLLQSRVRNYGRMTERRVVFATTLVYETPIEMIEKVPAMIRAIVESHKDARFDRSHFQKHASSSLDFETVYYVLSADFNKYMDIQQSINLQLHRKFAELEIEFAYPTQKLFMVSGAVSGAPDPDSGG
ncbi:MAG: mechanosensitive ion channel family protein [Pseudomonadota bacterium]